jgi:hypothetical protein
MGNLGDYLHRHARDYFGMLGIGEAVRRGRQTREEMIRGVLRLFITVSLISAAYYHGRSDRSLSNDFDARVIELGMTRQLDAAVIRADNLWVINHDLDGVIVSMETRLQNLANHYPKQYRAGIENEIAIMERFRKIAAADGGAK